MKQNRDLFFILHFYFRNENIFTCSIAQWSFAAAKFSVDKFLDPFDSPFNLFASRRTRFVPDPAHPHKVSTRSDN